MKRLKYKQNFISVIDKKLIPEIVDKIFKLVFEDLIFINKAQFQIELSEVLHINNLNKIQNDFQSRFKKQIPLSIC